MNLYIEHIPVATVNDQLFPSIAMGFNDTNPLVRETTIKVSDIIRWWGDADTIGNIYNHCRLILDDDM